MSEVKEVKKTGLALLREPFPDHLIGKLPKATKVQNECQASEKKNCNICGGWHHPRVIHLDYVGHAALTDRLLECDPEWNWEPLSFLPDGRPLTDGSGGMWIKLTVCGITRLGYGDAQGKTGPNAIKETIGDALRNAALRFGAALDLWSKEDLHFEDEKPEVEQQKQTEKPKPNYCTVEIFEDKKDAWKAAVSEGRYSLKSLSALVSSKYHFTEDQQKIIKSWEIIKGEIV